MQAGGGGGSGSHQTGLAHPSVGQTYNIQGVFFTGFTKKSMELIRRNSEKMTFHTEKL